MKLDFRQDWIEILRGELSKLGYAVDPASDFNTISVQYFNLRSRLISQRKREVKLSDTFVCPSTLSEAFEKLKAKIQGGQDLTPHLSSRIKNLEYDDPMLNDWGIFHLHLGQTVQANGFVERTGPLLYARVDSDCVYCINIYEHQNWTKQEMIEIVHRNWPQSIESYLLRGVIGLSHRLSDEELKEARKYNVNTAIEVAPGVVYAPIGGGYMSDGTGQRVVRSASHMAKILRQFEEIAKSNLHSFKEAASSQGIVLGDEPHIKLEVLNSKLLAVEQLSRNYIELGDMNK